jgi:hypothetical protein
MATLCQSIAVCLQGPRDEGEPAPAETRFRKVASDDVLHAGLTETRERRPMLAGVVAASPTTPSSAERPPALQLPSEAAAYRAAAQAAAAAEKAREAVAAVVKATMGTTTGRQAPAKRAVSPSARGIAMAAARAAKLSAHRAHAAALNAQSLPKLRSRGASPLKLRLSPSGKPLYMGDKASLRTKRQADESLQSTARTEASDSHSTARSSATADAYRMRWDEKYAR